MTTPANPTPRRIAIVGGGITGLAAAHRLREVLPDAEVTLLEAAPRLGGVVQTVRAGDYLIERAADMFTTKEPWALELCRRLGLENQLLPTEPQHRRAFVVHRGKLVPVPEGFTLMSPARIMPVLRTPLLTWRGKLRLAAERFVPPRRDGADESLASFASRRLGREAYQRLVQPLIGGIYTADPEKLSMQSAMPEFTALEREFGNLTRGIRGRAARQAHGSGARYSMFLALRDGMQTLVDTLAERLRPGSWCCNAVIEHIRCNSAGWAVQVRGEAAPRQFDRVLIAVPAHHAARLLMELDAGLANELAGIEYASVAIPVLGYRRAQIAHRLDGFGFVVPQIEQRQILSASFTSIKFAGRAPSDRVLLRVFIGGACQAELVDRPDDELYAMAEGELGNLLGIRGEPELRQLVRWRQAMPQYHLGHAARVARIEQRTSRWPGLHLCGNAYRGVGIPQCVHSGELAAEALAGIHGDQSPK